MNSCRYKLEAYRSEDNKLFQTKFGNNIELFRKEASRPYRNYYHRLYEKLGNRWKEISILN